MSLDDLPIKLADFKKRLSQVKAIRDTLRSEIVEEEAQVEKVKYKIDLNQKGSEVFKLWLENMLEDNVNSVSELVTSALSHVIDDQELIFKINREIKANRLSMNFVIEENGVEGDPLNSFGGGAVLFASFILRLSVMARMNMANLLILDESLSALANKYVPNAADFMKEISDKMGINILMVTHNEDFMANAHMAYEGYLTDTLDEHGNKTLRLRKRSVQ